MPLDPPVITATLSRKSDGAIAPEDIGRPGGR